jgi:hypothetical protein
LQGFSTANTTLGFDLTDEEQRKQMAKRLTLSFDRRNRPIEKFTFYEPIIDPKETKQRFFAGSGNITGFCELNN